MASLVGYILFTTVAATLLVVGAISEWRSREKEKAAAKREIIDLQFQNKRLMYLLAESKRELRLVTTGSYRGEEAEEDERPFPRPPVPLPEPSEYWE